ncbi:MAG: carboxypeptidase-like regulatory domain-containing protein, partial [Muribaculaceae bacterium]
MRGGIYKINLTFNAAGTSVTSFSVGDALVTFPESVVSTPTTYTAEVEASEENPVYIGLATNCAILDDFTFTATLPNTVSGTITAKDGVTTISDATVELLDGETVVAEATSADDGTYSFGTDAVPDGAYTLRVSAERYRTYEAATTISDDKTDLNALLEPKPKYNFSGAVSYNGVAVEGMQLNLAGGDTDVTCTTHGDGSFSFTDVLEGTYTLTVYCTPEYKPCTQTIVLDRDITDHEVTLSKYTLLGSVIYEGDEDYVLIKGASVVLKHGDTEIGTATTTANGEFSFSDLSGCDVNDPDDYYTLTASADGFVTESDNISLNGGVNVDKQFVLEWSKSTISGTVV